MSDGREVSFKRTWAEEHLHGYAVALKAWNAPDDEHTRVTLRNMVEDIIDEVLPAAVPSLGEHNNE